MQLGKKKKIKLTALYVETTTVNFSAYVWPFRLSRLFPTYVRTYTYVCVKLFFIQKIVIVLVIPTIGNWIVYKLGFWEASSGSSIDSGH